MHPDVLTLLEADEEARRRVAEAARAVEARVAEARAGHEARIAAARQARHEAVDRLVHEIQADGDRRAARQEQVRAEARRERAEAAERAIPDGVAAYRRIVAGIATRKAAEP